MLNPDLQTLPEFFLGSLPTGSNDLFFPWITTHSAFSIQTYIYISMFVSISVHLNVRCSPWKRRETHQWEWDWVGRSLWVGRAETWGRLGLPTCHLLLCNMGCLSELGLPEQRGTDWRHERQSFIFSLLWKSEITVAGSVSSEATPLGVGGRLLPASSHGLPLCRQGPVSPSREGTSCTGLGSILMNSF